MKKTYCDRCGVEMEQNDNILLRKIDNHGNIHTEDYFDICPACRESFFGWLNGKPAEQEKPVKVADKPAEQKKSAKKSPYTVAFIAMLANAPESTVRRHMEGICSTCGKDKQGRTVRYYHLSDEQRDTIIERIKNRKQGSRTKI